MQSHVSLARLRKALAPSPTELATDESDERRARQALSRACENLVRSAWSRVDLRPEEQVRDFLVDMVLDAPLMASLLAFGLEIRSKGCEALGVDATLSNALSQLRANIELLLSRPLPRRGQRMLHVSICAAMPLRVCEARGRVCAGRCCRRFRVCREPGRRDAQGVQPHKAD